MASVSDRYLAVEPRTQGEVRWSLFYSSVFGGRRPITVRFEKDGHEASAHVSASQARALAAALIKQADAAEAQDAAQVAAPCAWCDERPATRWAHDRNAIPDSANPRVCEPCFEADAEAHDAQVAA